MTVSLDVNIGQARRSGDPASNRRTRAARVLLHAANNVVDVALHSSTSVSSSHALQETRVESS